MHPTNMTSIHSADAERAPLLDVKRWEAENDSFDDTANIPAPHIRKLYLSHFLSTWNSRTFEFGATLYLVYIIPGTLVPMSVYALVRGFSALVFAPFIGSYIDSANRLQVVRISIVAQRLAVTISCGLFYILPLRWCQILAVQNTFYVLLAILACVEKVFSIMNSVSIERDWVVVIAARDRALLPKMNAQMRRIDLFCKILAPLFVASINDLSPQLTLVTMSIMNVCSIMIEYTTIKRVYHDNLDLQESKTQPRSMTDEASTINDVDGNIALQRQSYQNGIVTRSKHLARKFTTDFSFYIHHAAFLPSIAGALLYLTVLQFGGQMITFLLVSGYDPTAMTLTRTIGVLLEVSATWLTPWLVKRMGPVKAGFWLSFAQVTALVPSTTVFFLAAGKPSIAVGGLVAGVILSRLGLRGFGLCIQIIIQEDVEAENRGRFSSVEAAFDSIFELFSYGSTLVFSQADQFKWPVLISTIAVALANGAFALFFHQQKFKSLVYASCSDGRMKS